MADGFHGWTADRSALNFMRVFELSVAKSENFSDLNLPARRAKHAKGGRGRSG
jgi:hypothetical protein